MSKKANRKWKCAGKHLQELCALWYLVFGQRTHFPVDSLHLKWILRVENNAASQNTPTKSVTPREHRDKHRVVESHGFYTGDVWLVTVTTLLDSPRLRHLWGRLPEKREGGFWVALLSLHACALHSWLFGCPPTILEVPKDKILCIWAAAMTAISHRAAWPSRDQCRGSLGSDHLLSCQQSPAVAYSA